MRGFDDPTAIPGVFAQPWPEAGGKDHDRGSLPFHLDTQSSDAECTYDLSHAWNAQHMCWNNGAMDSFVKTHTSAQFEGPDNGVLTMGYYTRADLPFWYALADAFTICDNYHCSVMAPTHPNRLHAWSGTLDPAGEAGGPVIVTNDQAKFIGSASWRTMPEELAVQGRLVEGVQPAGQLLPALEPSVDRGLRQHPAVLPPARLGPELAAVPKRLLPAIPERLQVGRRQRNVAVSLVDHPARRLRRASTVAARGRHVVRQPGDRHPVVQSRRSGRRRCCSSPTTRTTGSSTTSRLLHRPRGTPGEYLTVDPLPAAAYSVAGPIGLGFRVPMLVVSPFSRGGYVCSDVLDHTSHLRFLETRFGVAGAQHLCMATQDMR